MIKKLKNEKGQAAVEFALVLPILLLLVCGIIDFGWMFYNQLSLDNACREAARYSCVNSSYSENELENMINTNMQQSLSGNLANTLDVDINFSDESKRTNGDVEVKLDAKMKVLTPVLGAFTDNMEKNLHSKVVMKVES